MAGPRDAERSRHQSLGITHFTLGAPADPSGCGIPVGMHTAEFQAERSFPTCGAVCFFAEPGNWGTSHSFSITDQ